MDHNISSGVKRIITDQAVVYDFAMDKDFQKKHESVNHIIEWVKPTDLDVHTNTVESSFSLLKRGLIGSFHRVSIKHLHRYLSEFEYRFNVRHINAKFEGIVARLMQTEKMPYKSLISDPGPVQA